MRNSENEYCWVEECSNDCGESNCNIFRTDDSQVSNGAYIWSTEECPIDETAMAYERASEAAESFEDTFATAFEEYCVNGNCVNEQQIDNATINSTASFFSETFEDESTKKITN